MLPDIWVKFSGCQFLYFDQLGFLFFINYIFSLWRNKPQKAGAICSLYHQYGVAECGMH